MDAALTAVLKLLGFGQPVLYAAATFGFFHWLDRKASGAAKKAIAGWFKPLEYDGKAVRAALVEAFDRIYGAPLLSWRSFGRSAVISVILTFAYFLIFDLNQFRREGGVSLSYSSNSHEIARRPW